MSPRGHSWTLSPRSSATCANPAGTSISPKLHLAKPRRHVFMKFIALSALLNGSGLMKPMHAQEELTISFAIIRKPHISNSVHSRWWGCSLAPAPPCTAPAPCAQQTGCTSLTRTRRNLQSAQSCKQTRFQVTIKPCSFAVEMKGEKKRRHLEELFLGLEIFMKFRF